MEDQRTVEKMEREERYAKQSMSWHGWGSHVGLGLGLVSVGLFLWLLHLASII